ncbi:MAG: dipeptidase [Pseudomonadota bacterium]
MEHSSSPERGGADPVAVFDGHNDFLLRIWSDPGHRAQRWLERNTEGHLDLPRMRAGGFAGGLFAIFVPPAERPGGTSFAERMKEAPYEIPLPPNIAMGAAQQVALAQAGLLLWMERTAPQEFALCRTPAEIHTAVASGRVAGLMHMEGAEAIDKDLNALHAFHAMGLRSLGPVWSRPTIFGNGVPFRFPGDPDTGPGLTDAGRRLVQECNALGIMIDLSHLNEKGVDDVAAHSDAPLVATHSNAHAVCPSPRNLTDRQLHQIAETRGMVGLNLATFFLRPDGRARRDVGMDVLMRHLDHLMSILGEDGVGLGSDFDGGQVPEGIGDVAGLPVLVAAMRAHGYGEALVAKIARDNWFSLLDRTLKP